MSFFCLYRIVSISLYSAITSINLKSKFFLDQTIPHRNHAISQKLPRSLSLKGLAELLPELTTATCSSPSPLQWSSLSLLRNGSCKSLATSVPTTPGHLLTCSHFLHFSAAVSTTSQPCFPSPTPIICMVLVLLLTAGLSCSESSEVCTSSDILLLGDGPWAQPHSFIFSHSTLSRVASFILRV